MIIRFFRAIVHDGQAEAFRAVFLETILPATRTQEGLISASIGLPHEGTPNEFSMITMWRDLDAIKAFAGERWRQPKIVPEEAQFIREAHAHHYVAADA